MEHRIVPERVAMVVERLGKFNRVLTPGLHLLIPIVCFYNLLSIWKRLAYAQNVLNGANCRRWTASHMHTP